MADYSGLPKYVNDVSEFQKDRHAIIDRQNCEQNTDTDKNE